ncbi:ENHANCER OF AG-4 protein 2-like [Phalaenopsis equestris]|uniref:ENHANCER OF AG-4 protein 2-like n=1 Tax=Phalaenopsis equestris TaxID=78828 RepID=UPI0009E258CF|nr:ENHANCER OF AG-4 protein 2-like [Phalaenopsis equestris]
MAPPPPLVVATSLASPPLTPIFITPPVAPAPVLDAAPSPVKLVASTPTPPPAISTTLEPDLSTPPPPPMRSFTWLLVRHHHIRRIFEVRGMHRLASMFTTAKALSRAPSVASCMSKLIDVRGLCSGSQSIPRGLL